MAPETAKHTKTPWRLVGGVTIIGPDGEPIAKVLMPVPSAAVREANAKFILLACNSHDDLLAVTTDLVAAARAGRLDGAIVGSIIKDAMEIIDKVEAVPISGG